MKTQKPNRLMLSGMAAAMLCAGLLTSIPARSDSEFSTRTPIKHIVVIFQENVSFDHYFGTYPHAAPNKDGSNLFGKPRGDTPRVNNLHSAGLLTHNPNGANPFRIDRSVPVTCDQDHGYSDEQFAFHGGLMDRFLTHSCKDAILGANSTLGYYDGNTVTALWNYAQHYAMSDNSFGTSFGPSTPGLLNLVAGTTYKGTITNGLTASGNIANNVNSGAVIGDPDPAGDICSNSKRTQITMSGTNIGDLLNAKGITWGAFMGGFDNCKLAHNNVSGASAGADYIPHHAFFQYWKSTQNAQHLPPGSAAAIGRTDQANHQYDLGRFHTALVQHNLPAVSFLKAPAFQDGHAGYSDPLDEQTLIVGVVNDVMRSPEWRETAIVIAYDDSDGWYDHVMGPIVYQSSTSDDQLLAPGSCGQPGTTDPAGGTQNGRCGYGPRLPLMVISPWAKTNYVDHRVTDQSSIIRFIEDNWKLPRIGDGSADAVAGTLDGFFDFDDGPRAGRWILDPRTGVVAAFDR
ncbi:alkaline phosphatase family protein [Burkholderia sp. Ac-20353]|uniref:phospholipase C n=1 Tax=Burkholderia sp. Ac-20353 TaxID=2703894 RepID=UPI00197B70B5|nr:alkaline phosphatase family protein [Burkholderia sp. Ac-20353]MBN3789470.1 alkaline phosphatase family protein [Burkholderia sp. Ac-20353]